NQVLAEAREMHADHGQAEEKLGHEIAIPDRVEAVLAELRETEFARDRFAVDDDGRAGDRAGTERQDVGAPGAIDYSPMIAIERLHLRQEIMAEQDRLRALEMGVAGHDRSLVSLR